MRVVIQRVSEASVQVEESIVGKIGVGLLVLLGIEDSDTIDDAKWLASKIVQMRIFNDERGVMNKSLLEVGGNVLLVSQFTLFASTKKGNRPSYIRASKGAIAKVLYETMISEINLFLPIQIQTGVFGADMKVRLLNDGPVTITMDSKEKE